MVKQPSCSPTFRGKVSKAREALGLSQADLGSRVDKAQTRIAKWLGGTGCPDPMTLVRLAEALRLPLAYLCDDRIDDPAKAPDAGGVLYGDAGRPLSEDEKMVRDLVQDLGVGVAKARLLLRPEPTGAPDGPASPNPAPPAPPDKAIGGRRVSSSVPKAPEPSKKKQGR